MKFNLKKYHTPITVFLITVFSISLLSLNAWAKPETLLTTNIKFGEKGNISVTYEDHGHKEADTLNHKIQSALIFAAYAVQEAGENRGKLLNQFQVAINKIYPKGGGLKPKADIVNDNPLMAPAKEQAKGKGFQLLFQKESVGNALNVNPLTPDSKALVIPAFFSFFQDLIRTSPEGGVHLSVLALSGMTNCYITKRSECDADAPSSVVTAPSYGLKLAVDLLENVAKKTVK